MQVLNLTSLFLSCIAFILASATTTTIAKELRFPNFPASFEESTRHGERGCVINDPRATVAIATNEGLKSIGGLNLMQTHEDGGHNLIVYFGESHGITLSFKGDDNLCVSDKLLGMQLNEQLSDEALSIAEDTQYSANQCGFTKRYGQICGAFAKVVKGLTKNGFRLVYQGRLVDGNFKTLMSGNGKSYYLTTHAKHGATVVTGVAEREFKMVD